MVSNIRRSSEYSLLRKVLLFLLISLPVYLEASGRKQDPSVTVRVSEGERVLISSDGAFRARPLEGAGEFDYNAEWIEIQPDGSGVTFDGVYLPVGVVFTSRDKEHLAVNGRRYRGSLIVIPAGPGVVVINEVDIEEYLRGVLPVEVSPSWPMESLKAQAVVSRTYAYNNLGKNSFRGFDLTDDVFSQVYRGVDVEADSTDQAIKATSNLLLYSDDSLTRGYFHSCCGGRTENISLVWQGRIPHMQGVECGFCTDSPRYNWESNISPEVISERLGRAGFCSGEIEDIRFISRTASGRIDQMEILTSSSTISLSGHRFRMAMGPDVIKSALFTVDRTAPEYTFYGRGWGHGVGLCQWGARGLALEGVSFRDILNFYFPGIQIRRRR